MIICLQLSSQGFYLYFTQVIDNGSGMCKAGCMSVYYVLIVVLTDVPSFTVAGMRNKILFHLTTVLTEPRR